MARPPFARRAPHTAGEPPAGGSTLDVLPHAYADFLAMERELASTELGFPVVDEASAKGDLAGTVMEMSALVAHVLALYSDRYGNEVFLGTASSPSSLVRHGRRLAYEPGPGVTASGYLALFAKDDLAGTISARFAFSSAPVGEKPAQDYELIEPVPIEASLNAILPVDIVEPGFFIASTNGGAHRQAQSRGSLNSKRPCRSHALQSGSKAAAHLRSNTARSSALSTPDQRSFSPRAKK